MQAERQRRIGGSVRQTQSQPKLPVRTASSTASGDIGDDQCRRSVRCRFRMEGSGFEPHSSEPACSCGLYICGCMWYGDPKLRVRTATCTAPGDIGDEGVQVQCQARSGLRSEESVCQGSAMALPHVCAPLTPACPCRLYEWVDMVWGLWYQLGPVCGSEPACKAA